MYNEHAHCLAPDIESNNSAKIYYVLLDNPPALYLSWEAVQVVKAQPGKDKLYCYGFYSIVAALQFQLYHTPGDLGFHARPRIAPSDAQRFGKDLCPNCGVIFIATNLINQPAPVVSGYNTRSRATRASTRNTPAAQYTASLPTYYSASSASSSSSVIQQTPPYRQSARSPVSSPVPALTVPSPEPVLTSTQYSTSDITSQVESLTITFKK